MSVLLTGGVRFTPDGLSGEAVKGNSTTTVIPGVDESKITPEELSEPEWCSLTHWSAAKVEKRA